MPFSEGAIVSQKTVELQPGRREFTNQEEAQEFACDRVREMWVVHCYQPNREREFWIVEWWCQ